MKTLITVLGMFLLFLHVSWAWSASLQGTISGTLKRASTPYHVTGDIVIEPGKSLTIEPGVVLLFDSTTVFRVEGNLQAVGKKAQPVLFKPFIKNPHGAAWEGIQFTNRGLDASQLKNCIIERARRGVSVFSVSPSIENCQIRLCDQEGILLRVSRARITNNRITENRTDGIHAVAFKGLIKGNEIDKNNEDGVYLEKSPCTVEGNTIRANKDDGLFCIKSNAVIRNNRIEQNGDDAILIGQCAPVMFNNILVRSDFGLFVYRNSSAKVANCTISGNKYGIYVRDNANARIDNSIVWDNETPVFTDSTSSVKITFSDMEGGFPGEGNYSAHPGFSGTDYSTVKESSPCNSNKNPHPIYKEPDSGMQNKTGARLKLK